MKTLVALIATIVIVAIGTYCIVDIIETKLNEPLSPQMPEHTYYLNIRETSNCTRANDTYCIERGGCVHNYEACQMRQCPEDFP